MHDIDKAAPDILILAGLILAVGAVFWLALVTYRWLIWRLVPGQPVQVMVTVERWWEPEPTPEVIHRGEAQHIAWNRYFRGDQDAPSVQNLVADTWVAQDDRSAEQWEKGTWTECANGSASTPS
jgi:hypothetical protein